MCNGELNQYRDYVPPDVKSKLPSVSPMTGPPRCGQHELNTIEIAIDAAFEARIITGTDWRQVHKWMDLQ